MTVVTKVTKLLEFKDSVTMRKWLFDHANILTGWSESAIESKGRTYIWAKDCKWFHDRNKEEWLRVGIMWVDDVSVFVHMESVDFKKVESEFKKVEHGGIRNKRSKYV